MARLLRYSVAMSLDGFIADQKGGYGWITMDPAIDFDAYMARFDTFVMGRGTYEVAGGGGPGLGKGTKVYVVSTTLDPAQHPKVTIISRDVEKRVADLKAEEGKDIWLFGGGVLFRTLLEAGLVDRVEVGVMPALLGQGIPLLAGFGGMGTGGGKGRRRGSAKGSWARLRLRSLERMPSSGIVMLDYEVENPDPPRRAPRRKSE